MVDEEKERYRLIEEIQAKIEEILKSDLISEEEKAALIREALLIVQGEDK